LKRMKNGRVPGIDEVCTEMIIAVGKIGVGLTKRLLNACVSEGSVPEDCRTGLIVPRWKRKGDVQGPLRKNNPLAFPFLITH